MSSYYPALINVLGFQLGWWLIVAIRAPWCLAVGVCLLLLHITTMAPRPWEEAVLIAAVGLAGSLLDSALSMLGILAFEGGHVWSPPWLWLIWMLFAATLGHSLKALRPYPLIAALLGAVAGPLAYYSGMRLGALQPESLGALQLATLALLWGMLTPALITLQQHWPVLPIGRSTQTASHRTS